jgi:hypothetical protein
MDIGMTTDIAEHDRTRIWGMVCADCDFLQRQQLLDYSLLLGIYRPDKGHDPKVRLAQLRRLAAQCHGTGVISRDRQKVYFFGMIDVLEKFTIRWRVQRAALRLLYCLAMRWTSVDGISAMPPSLYADRLRTCTAYEVLHMERPHPSPSTILDERWREGGWWAMIHATGRRLLGLPTLERGARRGGKARWYRLWERRRRGLVKQRIDSEHEDQMARIAELEEHVSGLEHQLTVLRGFPEETVDPATEDSNRAAPAPPGHASEQL